MIKHTLIRVASIPTLVLVLLIAFAAFGARGGVSADPGDDIPTSATVGGGGTAPTIVCKWELPDVDSTTAGIQYGDDDTPAQDPTPVTPCSGSPATQAEGATHMIGVNPNPENLPEPQRIQLWMVVAPPSNGAAISGVFWQVFHPDGTPKVQVTGTLVESGGGVCAVPAGMVAAAEPPATGQLSTAAWAYIDSLCRQGGLFLYYGEFDLHKEQHCGQYRVVAHSTSLGNEDTLTNFFDVPCTNNLRVDFSTLNWGNITPGTEKIIIGDSSLSPLPPDNGFAPPNGVHPTVKNVGNSGMTIHVIFSDMIQQPPTTLSKRIVDFDSCFGRSAATIVCKGSGQTPNCPLDMPAGGWPAGCHDFDFDFSIPSTTPGTIARAQVLCANEDGKLDLSIHPQSTLPPGTYLGTVDVIAVSEAALGYCGENDEAGGGQ